MYRSYQEVLALFNTAKSKEQGKPITGQWTRLYKRDDGVLWVGLKDGKAFNSLSLEIHPDNTLRLRILSSDGGDIQRTGNALEKLAHARFHISYPRRVAKHAHTFFYAAQKNEHWWQGAKHEFGFWIHFDLATRTVVAHDPVQVRVDDLELRRECQRTLRQAKEQALIRFDLGVLNDLDQVKKDINEARAIRHEGRLAGLYDRMAKSEDMTYADFVALLAHFSYGAWWIRSLKDLRDFVQKTFESDTLRRAYFEAKGAYKWAPQEEKKAA